MRDTQRRTATRRHKARRETRRTRHTRRPLARLRRAERRRGTQLDKRHATGANESL